MVRSMVVGLDGSAYSTAAVELGLCWAQRYEAVLVGLGVIDAPTICQAQPVPLGATAYKVQRDARLLADAHHTVAQFVEHYAQRCAEARVRCQVRQEVGSPAECLLLEAQRDDLIVLGQQTFFHFATQDTPDDTLSVVVKQSPCPVVAIPATLPEGRAVVVAYDGSRHATRALHMFQALELASASDVHVVCVDAQQERATSCAARAVAFLHGHNIGAQAHALATSASPAQVILEQVHQVEASVLVMGAYGRSPLRELFGTSLTSTMLRESPVPLFLSH
jgi:nucleotide-binding universal stress UspA family protein